MPFSVEPVQLLEIHFNIFTRSVNPQILMVFISSFQVLHGFFPGKTTTCDGGPFHRAQRMDAPGLWQTAWRRSDLSRSMQFMQRIVWSQTADFDVYVIYAYTKYDMCTITHVSFKYLSDLIIINHLNVRVSKHLNALCNLPQFWACAQEMAAKPLKYMPFLGYASLAKLHFRHSGVWMKEAIAPRIDKLGDLQIHSNCTIPTSAQDPFIHIPDSWDGRCGIENQSWHLSISWIWMFTSGCDTKTWACRIPSVWYMMVYGPRISLCTQLYNRSSWLAASGWQFLRTSREFTGALPRTLITSLQSEMWELWERIEPQKPISHLKNAEIFDLV